MACPRVPQLSYQNDLPKLNGVRFSVLSKEQIERLSCVEIKSYSLSVSKSLDGTLLCRHMGALDERTDCKTCGKGSQLCNGHTGSLKLALPVLHFGFIDYILKLLRCICFFCSRLRNQSELDVSNFSDVYNNNKGKHTCEHCKGPCPDYLRVGSMMQKNWPSNTKFASESERAFAEAPLTVIDIQNLLHCISDDTCRRMGLDPKISHPRNLVLSVLLIPPLCIRPSVISMEGSRAKGQDDLTLRLQEIVKYNTQLTKLLQLHDFDPGASDAPRWPVEIEEAWLRLQGEIASYMDISSSGGRIHEKSKNTGSYNGSSRLSACNKSIACRLKGKEGRVRGNLMGKRVDHCARTVISPNPYMWVDEVGVPEEIAYRLTVPEKVCQSNYVDLLRAVCIGSGKKGGAESIISPRGDAFNLAFCNDLKCLSEKVRQGWVVERHLRDGDYVVFNRQPSLHKGSLMAHKVRILPGHTFRLNLSCAQPYNADFDGDEMNLHVPQGVMAATEARMLLNVSQQLLSPQACRPIMGIVQDSLVGAYIMSLPSTTLSRAELSELVMTVDDFGDLWQRIPEPAISYPVELWTGKQALSMILQGIFYDTAPPHIDAGAPGVVIIEGRLLHGLLGKSVLGAGQNSLIHHLLLSRSGESTIEFMTYLQRMTTRFLMTRGFSVGVADCLQPEGARNVIANVRACGPSVEIADENTAMLLTSKLHAHCVERICETTHVEDNSILAMVSSGSKGNTINVGQIMGFVGQNTVQGVRIEPQRCTKRTLPCFRGCDSSLLSRGFVHNSYIQGLLPAEYFFHAMGGREGLVDTAVKTATTGYIQRKMVKSMESHTVTEDGSVRDEQGKVVCFQYGDDGLNPIYLRHTKVPELAFADDAFRMIFACCRENTRDFFAHLRSLLHTKSRETYLRTPFDCVSLLKEFSQCMCPADSAGIPEELGDDLSGFITSTILADLDTETQTPLQHTEEGLGLCALQNALYLAIHLAPVLRRFERENWQRLLQQLRLVWRRSQIPVGEMVGCIAAQSIGEPCTQMTLNTFHSAGVANRKMTVGVPRLKELIDVSRNPTTPCYVLRPRIGGLYHAQRACSMLRTYSLEALVKSVSERQNAAVPPEFTPFGPYGDCCVELQLDAAACQTLCLLPVDIALRLEHDVPGCRCTWEDDMTVRVFDSSLAVVREALHSSLSKGMLPDPKAELSVETRLELERRQDGSVKRSTVHEIQLAFSAHSILNLLVSLPEQYFQRDLCRDNNICSVFASFGLEAAIGVLMAELENIISSDGTSVDTAHILLMVNSMSYRGYLMPLSRHGINKTENGPLLRCSFEETCEVLKEAALFGLEDSGDSVTQSIMLGQLARAGTGRVKVCASQPSANRQCMEYLVKKEMSHTTHRTQETIVATELRKRKRSTEREPEPSFNASLYFKKHSSQGEQFVPDSP